MSSYNETDVNICLTLVCLLSILTSCHSSQKRFRIQLQGRTEFRVCMFFLKKLFPSTVSQSKNMHMVEWRCEIVLSINKLYNNKCTAAWFAKNPSLPHPAYTAIIPKLDVLCNPHAGHLTDHWTRPYQSSPFSFVISMAQGPCWYVAVKRTMTNLRKVHYK